VDSYSRALVKEGHEVLIVCSDYPEGLDAPSTLNQTQEGGPKIIRVPSVPAFITKEDRIAKLNKFHWVFKQVDQFRPNVVHINTEFVIAEFGFFYARAYNLPAIYTFHTMWEDYGPNYFPMFPAFLVKFVIRRILKNLLRRSYRVIVPTTQIDEVVRKYRPRTTTLLLPTGIEPELFLHSADESALFRKKMEERFPRLEGKRILLFAGRITKEKNLSFLINILPPIRARHPDIVLLFVGNGPDVEYYREEARRIGVEQQTVFTGYMERTQLALAYTIADVFVFPSLTDTQGLVTLEAMLSGTPVVAIGALGTLQVMGGNHGGFMVENIPGDFITAVLSLLDNEELRREKSLEAKEHARSWSIGELTKRLIEIYDSAVKSFVEDYGQPRTPVWELVTNKRWWRINNKIFRKRTRLIWRRVKAKLIKS